MKRASIRDLHLRTGAIVSEAARGSVIVIEKRGVPVAELRPIERLSPARMLREIEPLLRKLPKLKGDSGRFISESRDRRRRRAFGVCKNCRLFRDLEQRPPHPSRRPPISG